MWKTFLCSRKFLTFHRETFLSTKEQKSLFNDGLHGRKEKLCTWKGFSGEHGVFANFFGENGWS
jgi:hypothetical protein